jgi:hypothetical protein
MLSDAIANQKEFEDVTMKMFGADADVLPVESEDAEYGDRR